MKGYSKELTFEQKTVKAFTDPLNEQIKKLTYENEYLKEKLRIANVSSCYALFNEEDNIVLIYQTEEKANKRMEEFKRSHEHTDFYVDTIKIH